MYFAEIVVFGLGVGFCMMLLSPFRRWLERRLLSYFLKREGPGYRQTFEAKKVKTKDRE
jgi:hypothetical protein